MTLEVEDIDFDPVGILMRVKGRNIEESEHVKMGAYHTIDLELNRSFTISKSRWDTIDIERLDIAADPSKTAGYICIFACNMYIIIPSFLVSIKNLL